VRIECRNFFQRKRKEYEGEVIPMDEEHKPELWEIGRKMLKHSMIGLAIIYVIKIFIL